MSVANGSSGVINPEVIYIRNKYPNRVPILIEPKDSKTPQISHKKYIVDGNINIGEFMSILRKRINLNANQSIFIFAKNQILSNTNVLRLVYEHCKDSDGFLRLTYALENTFG